MHLIQVTIQMGLLLSFALSAQADEGTKVPSFKASAAEALCHRNILDMDLEVPFFMVGLDKSEFSAQVVAQARQENQAHVAQLRAGLQAQNAVDEATVAQLTRPSSVWLIGGLLDRWADRSEATSLRNQVAQRAEKLAVLERLNALFARLETMSPSLAPGLGRPVRGLSESFDDLIAEWLYRQAVQNFVALRELQIEIKEEGPASTAPMMAALDEVDAGLTDLEAVLATPGKHAVFTPVFARFLRAGAHARLAQWQAHSIGLGRGYTPLVLKQFLPIALSSGLALPDLDLRFQALRAFADGPLAHRQLNESDLMAWVYTSSRERNSGAVDAITARAMALDLALKTKAPAVSLTSSDFVAALDILHDTDFGPVSFAEKLQKFFVLSQKMPSTYTISPTGLIILIQHSRVTGKDVDATFADYFQTALTNAVRGEERFSDNTVAVLSGLQGNRLQLLLELRQLRTSRSWSGKSPDYSEADWVRLYMLSRYYAINVDTVADLAVRTFEIRGKELEAGRLISILQLALQTKFGDQRASYTPSGVLTDDELREFAILPHVRLNLPLTRLRPTP